MIETDQQFDPLDRPVSKMHHGADPEHQRCTDGEDDHRGRAPRPVGPERRHHTERNRRNGGPTMQQTAEAGTRSPQEPTCRCAEVFGAGIIEQGWRYLHEPKG